MKNNYIFNYLSESNITINAILKSQKKKLIMKIIPIIDVFLIEIFYIHGFVNLLNNFSCNIILLVKFQNLVFLLILNTRFHHYII